MNGEQGEDLDAATAPATPPMRVVLLEDDGDLRALMYDQLRERGYAVAAYSTPLDFCAACTLDLATNRGAFPVIDILITDNRMPGMTGVEFIESALKYARELQPENCCVMSSYLTEDEQSRILALGCRIISKAASARELAHWLGKCDARVRASRGPRDDLLRDNQARED